MKCKVCGSPVTRVVQSHDWQDAFTKRQRRCIAGHLFDTFEVYCSVVNKKEIAIARRGVERRRLTHQRRAAAQQSTEPVAVVAQRLGVSQTAVRYLRKK